MVKKKGYWFVHGTYGNEHTFLGYNKQNATKKVTKMNKSRLHKGKLVKL